MKELIHISLILAGKIISVVYPDLEEYSFLASSILSNSLSMASRNLAIFVKVEGLF
jgi:hypothetical protein